MARQPPRHLSDDKKETTKPQNGAFKKFQDDEEEDKEQVEREKIM